MKPLTKAEKFIRKAFLSDDITLRLTCDLFLWHYRSIDANENTSHCRTIDFLYRSQNNRLTKQGIANEIFSNVRSLKTAREKYADYFYYFYRYVKDKNISAESAITVLR